MIFGEDTCVKNFIFYVFCYAKISCFFTFESVILLECFTIFFRYWLFFCIGHVFLAYS